MTTTKEIQELVNSYVRNDLHSELSNLYVALYNSDSIYNIENGDEIARAINEGEYVTMYEVSDWLASELEELDETIIFSEGMYIWVNCEGSTYNNSSLQEIAAYHVN